MMLYVNFHRRLCKIVHALLTATTLFVFSCNFDNISLASEIIAILDSGLNKDLPVVGGKNFFDNTNDTQDEVNHGSELAKEVLAVNSGAKFLAVKITRNGDGITPEILAKAIRYSADSNAQFINFSFALSKDSKELQNAIKYAAKKNIVLVAAAGIGLKNPYEPMDVSKIFPQSYSEVLVVGKSLSCTEPDEMSNFGKKIDFVIPEDETKKRGSSYTAARALGLLSLLISKNKLKEPFNLSNLKKTLEPYLTPIPKNIKKLHKMGGGCLDSKKIIEATGKGPTL
ncbi:MAG: hypothetical protein A4S09_14370 [Proteobacteria bacterium SG_bin7]|nr:MAG: hypothetical protein A4S09_14370 [Proteobacteria bacterium SG_bin7]